MWTGGVFTYRFFKFRRCKIEFQAEFKASEKHKCAK
jgi:hypothetical protein